MQNFRMPQSNTLILPLGPYKIFNFFNKTKFTDIFAGMQLFFPACNPNTEKDKNRMQLQILKLRKCSILRKILAHFEFDSSNISQKKWYRAMFTHMQQTPYFDNSP